MLKSSGLLPIPLFQGVRMSHDWMATFSSTELSLAFKRGVPSRPSPRE